MEKKEKMRMLKQGLYMAEKNDNIFDEYKITMEVKETEKSYIFRLVEFKSRYSGSHIQTLFKNAKRVVLRKSKGGHAMRVWSDEDFTFYPYQAGIPYWFQKVQETTG